MAPAIETLEEDVDVTHVRVMLPSGEWALHFLNFDGDATAFWVAPEHEIIDVTVGLA